MADFFARIAMLVPNTLFKSLPPNRAIPAMEEVLRARTHQRETARQLNESLTKLQSSLDRREGVRRGS